MDNYDRRLVRVLPYRWYRKDPEFLTLFHINGYAQSPQGGIEFKEDIDIAGLRETREETGLKSLFILPNARAEAVYYVPQKSQRQHVTAKAALLYVPDEPVVVNPREHVSAEWLQLDDMLFLFSGQHDKPEIERLAREVTTQMGLFPFYAPKYAAQMILR